MYTPTQPVLFQASVIGIQLTIFMIPQEAIKFGPTSDPHLMCLLDYHCHLHVDAISPAPRILAEAKCKN